MISRISLVLSILALAACGGGGSEGNGFNPQTYTVNNTGQMCLEYTPTTQENQNQLESQGWSLGTCARENSLGSCEYFDDQYGYNLNVIYYQDSSGLLTTDLLRQSCNNISGRFVEPGQEGGDSTDLPVAIAEINIDTDYDGFTDYIEVEYGTNPALATSTPMAILSNAVDFTDDNDGDGFSDDLEGWFYTDPNDSNSKPVDEDNNLIPDGFYDGGDGSVPKLLGFNIYDNALNIITGLETVTFNLTVIDDYLGVNRVKIILVSADGLSDIVIDTSISSNGNLSQGLSLESGAFGGTAYSGNWTVDYVGLEDTDGKLRNYNTDELIALGFDTLMTVNN